MVGYNLLRSLPIVFVILGVACTGGTSVSKASLRAHGKDAPTPSQTPAAEGPSADPPNDAVVATLSGVPLNISRASRLDVKVGGVSVAAYKYALIHDVDGCSVATYGSIRAVNEAITDVLGEDGLQVLCVIGFPEDGDDARSEQVSPTVAKWTKDTTPPTLALASSLPTWLDRGAATLAVNTDHGSTYTWKIAASCGGEGYSAPQTSGDPVKALLEQPGTYKLCFKVQDASGNETAKEYDLGVRGHEDIAPVVTPKSETELALSWPAATGPAQRYDVYVSLTKDGDPLDRSPVKSITNVATTSTTLADLPVGGVGKVVLRAELNAATTSSSSTATRWWTPHGAVNADNVNSVHWVKGTVKNGTYLASMFVSDAFSLFWTHPYHVPASHVFDKVPSYTEESLYNFGSPVITNTNGFRLASTTDVSQIWSDGQGRLAIVLYNHHRVLIYNHLPISPETRSPDLILGQTDFTNKSQHGVTGQVSAADLRLPSGVCFNGTTLYVSDTGNNRILGWNGWPTQMGEEADFVIGQSSFSGASSGNSSAGVFNQPMAIACTDGKLVVADSSNNRVLVWNTAPTSNIPADAVIGQSATNLFGTNGAGGSALGGMNRPIGVALVPNGPNVSLLVADSNNHRVLQWDTLPAGNGEAFDSVYGQPDHSSTTSNNGGMSLSTMSSPAYLSVELTSQGERKSIFWVADGANGRFMRFIIGQPVAERIFGHPDAVTEDWYPYYSKTSRFLTTGWALGTHSLVFALDPQGYFGVQGIGTPPNSWGVAPANGRVSASSALTKSLTRLGSRFYWASGERILSQDVPTGVVASATDAMADISLGRKDLASADNIAVPDSWEYKVSPTQVLAAGNKLLAVDGPRIVVWNTAPSVSHRIIDVAIGQPSLTTRAANQGGVSASSLHSAASAATHGAKLLVADKGNNRVMIWNAIPVTSGVAADVILGQVDGSTNAIGTSLGAMNSPTGVAVLNGKLFVSDTGNNRLLIWDEVPTNSATVADHEFDLSSVTFSLPSWYEKSFLAPQLLGVFDGRLYVGQHDRILVMPDIW